MCQDAALLANRLDEQVPGVPRFPGPSNGFCAASVGEPAHQPRCAGSRVTVAIPDRLRGGESDRSSGEDSGASAESAGDRSRNVSYPLQDMVIQAWCPIARGAAGSHPALFDLAPTRLTRWERTACRSNIISGPRPSSAQDSAPPRNGDGTGNFTLPYAQLTSAARSASISDQARNSHRYLAPLSVRGRRPSLRESTMHALAVLI